MATKTFSQKAQTIIKIGASATSSTVLAPPSTPVTTSGNIPPTAPTPIPNKITNKQRELLLAQVAQMYQTYYDKYIINAKVEVIPQSDRKLHNNSNLSISFRIPDMGNVLFYHKAFFSTPNSNGNTWNAEDIATYGTHDSVSIHVVDNPLNLQMTFQYIMTSKDLQAYFPNVSTNGRAYFALPAIAEPHPHSSLLASHVDDFSVLFSHYLRCLEVYKDIEGQALAYHIRSLLGQAQNL